MKIEARFIAALAICTVTFLTRVDAQNTFPASGSVGIGTTSPAYQVDVENSQVGGTIITVGNRSTLTDSVSAEFQASTTGTGVLIGAAGPNITNFGVPDVAGLQASSGQLAGTGYMIHFNNVSAPFILETYFNSPLIFGTTNSERLRIADSGNVGIGTKSPGALLEVNGNVKLTAGSGAWMTYADGTVQSTAWNGTALGGDYAESVDVANDPSGYEPGDIIVIDRHAHGKFLKSDKPYSKMVAGIYSTKPGLVGRRQGVDRAAETTEIPMALVGIVPTKVTAENGPIEDGDLLVTSSTPGVAMKGTDTTRMMGAVLGKALNGLDSGTGTIEVLIHLQ